MNRLFVYALIINVALLVVFILLDSITWNAVAVNLNSRMQTILTPNGIYTYNVTDIYSNYGLVWVGVNVRYVIPYVFMNPQDSVGISINLPLIWFIVTIVVNLCMIWYYGIKRMSELTKGSKTETISPSEQKIN